MFLLTGFAGAGAQAMEMFPRTFSFWKINSQGFPRQVFEGPKAEPLMKMIQDRKLSTA